MTEGKAQTLAERHPPDRSGLHLLIYWFTPGYTKTNVAMLLYATSASLAMLTLVNFIQPYLLEEVFKIPRAQQGSLTGNLAALQEVVVICLMGLVGALSDRTGRRILFAAGFVVLGLGYFIYPFADSVLQLYLFRIIVAVGAAMVPVMLSACLVDIIQETTRGKWLGTTSIFNGIGVLFMGAVLGQMPARFEDMGYSGVEAGQYTFWIATAMCLMTAVLLHFGLKGGPPPEVKDRPSVLKNLGRGLSEARRNPRIALAYASAFIARGDLVVVGTFFSLWFVQAGVDNDMTAGQAMKQAGGLFALIQISAMCWAFIMGLICDRVNRTTAVAIAFAIASVGYITLGSIGDPFAVGSIITLACVMTGMGETATVVASGALLGQEAPPHYRGAVVGVFNKSGAIGIMLATIIGGQLVNIIGPNAPFLMMGVCNAVILVLALSVRLWANGPVPEAPIEAGAAE
ncbi:MAG: MFS transporter [Rhodospirillaceae bacterium]|nr:MFS transporter [Rhodospirillaceae bacterium]MBT7449397.1 MFS transporter [Rhodospirillaceae bacterium]